MGACDYFTYNGGEFYVNARMYHVQFCPLSVDQAVLKLPTMPDRGLAITQVRKLVERANLLIDFSIRFLGFIGGVLSGLLCVLILSLEASLPC